MKYSNSLGLASIATFCLTVLAAPSGLEDNGIDDRAEIIKSAFKHAWKGYSDYAYGHDELQPLTNGTTDSRNGWGASIFDALDTIIIMDLEEDYLRACEHIKGVDWNKSKDPSKTFETNIRYLGGLLSAYDLKGDEFLLKKAIELADNVIMPAGKPVETNNIILAEFGSLQLELVHLTQLTGDDQYEIAGNNIIAQLSEVPTKIPGLYPMTWNLDTFTPNNMYHTISGGADSYYEYLLKTHILMEGKEELQLDMWNTAVGSMRRYLRSETHNGKVYLAEFQDHFKLLQSGELVCFMPGNLLLGARYLKDETIEMFARDLMNSCYDVWDTPTGLAPETWSWIDKEQDITTYPELMQKVMLKSGFVTQDSGYDLRPETIESLFYFYRITGDKTYQDKAWKIFEAIEKHCKTPSGYTRIADVTNINDVKPLNFEESYFFAETLKYLYLIFTDPDHISLDEYIFNTEAHPFKLKTPIQVQSKTFS
ncbi:glycoside hydrolase [Thamnidium elegans]|nr:glycoside hydrolase [Thamnidium elegans]